MEICQRVICIISNTRGGATFLCPSPSHPNAHRAAYCLRRWRTTRCRAFRRLRFFIISICSALSCTVLHSALLYRWTDALTDSNARSWQDTVDVLIPERRTSHVTNKSLHSCTHISPLSADQWPLCSANKTALHYSHAVITIRLRVICRHLRTRGWPDVIEYVKVD